MKTLENTITVINGRKHVRTPQNIPVAIGNKIVMCGVLVCVVRLGDFDYVYQSKYNDSLYNGFDLSQYPLAMANDKVKNLVDFLNYN